MSEALEIARTALAGTEAWVVGGAVRDRLLGRDTEDVDLASARDPAAGLRLVSPERIFAEVKRVVASRQPRAGIELADRLGVLEQVLPELTALRGVEQNRYHHADVLGHTLDVLDETVALTRDPGAVLGAEHDAPL